MTMVIDPLPPFVYMETATVRVTIVSASPVHAVSFDLLSDGQPAWYFVAFDGRGAQDYTIGPFKRRVRSEFVVHAFDEMGCEVTNDTRLYVTVQ